MISRFHTLLLFVSVSAGLLQGVTVSHAEVWKLETIVKGSVLSLSVLFSESDKVTIECNGIQDSLWFVRTMSLDAMEQKSKFSGSIRIGKLDFPIEVVAVMNGEPYVFSGVLFAKKEFLQAISNNHDAHVKFPMDNLDFAIDQDQGKAFAIQCAKLLKLKLV